jgi:hypothetical protein
MTSTSNLHAFLPSSLPPFHPSFLLRHGLSQSYHLSLFSAGIALAAISTSRNPFLCFKNAYSRSWRCGSSGKA